ncbi:MAG: phosphotransferase [Chloroflexi bacterium]|nr:phosphotransferase [Chloroflexota bacterium]
MPDFANWTLDEQKRFWFGLARDVIELWGLGASHLSWLGYSSNAVFKVSAPRGIYVLRVHLPGRVRAEYLASELTWLQNLGLNTDLLAPAPVPLQEDAADLLFASLRPARLAPDAVLCSLFKYIDGESKSARELSADDVGAVGAYLGQLHREGQFEPPDGFMRPRMDGEGLFGEESPYSVRDSVIATTAEQADTFGQVEKRLRTVMAAIDRGPDSFGLIHGDLLAKNILHCDGQPAALDFEYCGWGYFLYDLAPLLWQLKGERPDDYRHLEEAMWSGYRSKTGLDERMRAHLEVLIAVRQLASCRWLQANAGHPALREIAPKLLEDRTSELRDFLKTGVLKRESLTL